MFPALKDSRWTALFICNFTCNAWGCLQRRSANLDATSG